MCHASSMVDNTVVFFKIVEPVFWVVEAMIVANLLFQKKSFDKKLRVLNTLLHWQGFDSQIVRTEKAFQTWRRDLWILLFLIPLVIMLIHLI